MRTFFLGLVFLIQLFNYGPALAQITAESEGAAVKSIQPIITGRTMGRIDDDLLFDASLSLLPELKESYRFSWDFGDGNRDEGLKVKHNYKKPGIYKLTLEITGFTEQESIVANVFIYEKLYLFLTDKLEAKETISSLFHYAQERGIYLKIVESYESGSDFLSEELLARRITEVLDDVALTDRIIIWTRSSSGLTVLSGLSNLSAGERVQFFDKSIVFISDSNLSTLENIGRGIFSAIKPERIILTHSEALWPLVDSLTIDDFLQVLGSREIPHRVIESAEEKWRVSTFMSDLVNFMIERGIPSNTIKLILVLPLIATIIAFLKQVVGITTLGIYTPSIITLCFIALNLKFGLFLFVVLLIVASVTRIVLSRYRLLYIPRVAILLTLVSLTIFALFGFGALYKSSSLVSIAIFPMLIMSTLVEKFVSVQTEQGFRSALLLIGQTLAVSILGYFVAEWDFVKTMMLGHPEIIFVLLIFDIGLGRWTGLRLSEYWRFREVINKAEE